MMTGLLNGMNSQRSAAVSTARSIAQAINREYAKVQDIHSPSKVWAGFGMNQIQGGIKGMEKGIPALKSTAREASEVAMPYSGAYTPESTASYSRSRTTESNVYSPQFVLNMNGASATEDNKRKVKKWIRETLEEMFDNLDSEHSPAIEI